MKKIIYGLMFLIGCLIYNPNSVMSYAFNVNIGDQITGISYNTLTNAGAFELWDVNTQHQWTSFCLEYNQTLPQTAYVGKLSNYAFPGGVSGATGSEGDPISDFTAWLYLNSEHGYLYDYDGQNQDSHDLQKLIWFNEGELLTEGSYYNAAQVAVWKTTFQGSNWTNDGIVQVVNMFKDQALTIHAQDQLILGNIVPEPSTLFLFGIGLLMFSKTIRRT